MLPVSSLSYDGDTGHLNPGSEVKVTFEAADTSGNANLGIYENQVSISSEYIAGKTVLVTPVSNPVEVVDSGETITDSDTRESISLTGVNVTSPMNVHDQIAFIANTSTGGQAVVVADPVTLILANTYSPAKIRHAYGVDSIPNFTGENGQTEQADGTGQTIAIINSGNDTTIVGDLHAFDSYFGLPDPSLTVVKQPEPNPIPNDTDDGETARWMWNGHTPSLQCANIVLIECNSSYSADAFWGVAEANLLANKQQSAALGIPAPVSVVSMSWSLNESQGTENAYDALFNTAQVTYVSSSGDEGAPADYPPFSPSVIAVGGTTLYLNPDNSYQSETAWGVTGGSASLYEDEPAYQTGVVPATLSGGHRATPDVAFDADGRSGVPVFDTSEHGWSTHGGTSLGTPCWAGLIAIVNQGRAAIGKAPLTGATQTLPDLYELAGADFHDITTGNNAQFTYDNPTNFPNNNQPAQFSAAAGYDMVTGLGSPVANLLVPDLVAMSPSLPTITTSQSPDVTLVNGSTPAPLTDSADLAGGQNPTGTITFTLNGQGGGVVDTETVNVNGNGSYNTPAGYTLPTTGTVAGTYQWVASYSGDANNTPVASTLGSEPVTVTAGNPTISTTQSVTNVTLHDASIAPLTDAADLENGYYPTGTITFTLNGPGGVVVDTETVTVHGNGSYSTPAGYTLPTTGTVAATYQWVASYNGDANNTPVASTLGSEPVTVTGASPTISTTQSANVTLADRSFAPLTDSADLEEAYYPTGTITFTLNGPGGGVVDTETVTVNGNGSYSTPAGYTLPTAGTVVGTYQWVASYNGDANNAPVASTLGSEPVTVTGASPTISTTQSITNITLYDASIAPLTDTADLENGYYPTGTITFTLNGPGGGGVDTETATVNGNGSYSTPAGYALPTTGTVVGTYQWVASYSGDANNAAVGSTSGTETVTVGIASPTITTTASGAVVAGGGVPLTDAATVSGGYYPTGTITFTLTAPDGVTVMDAETVTVNGDGTYTTPNGFVPILTGTYEWVASYSGDGNNKPAASTTGTDPETVDPASFQWTGQGANDLWSNPNNWLSGLAPVAGAILTFPSGARQLTTDNDLGYTFNSVITADNYRVTNLLLKVTDDLTVQQGSLQLACSATVSGTISVQGTLEAGATLTVAAGGTLDDRGTVTVDGGAVLDEDGSLSVAHSALVNDSGKVTVAAGVTMSVAGTLTVENAASLDIKGTVEIGSGGSLNDQGTITVETGGRLSDGDAITVAAGATLDVSGDLTEAGSGLDDRGSLIIEPGATLGIVSSVTIAAGATYSPLGTVTLEPGGSINLPPVQAATTMALTSSADPSVFGQRVTFTATIGSDGSTATSATGTVTFDDAGTSIGTGSVSGGTATLSTTVLSPGTQTVTAFYSGDSNFLSTDSSAVAACTVCSSSEHHDNGNILRQSLGVRPKCDVHGNGQRCQSRGGHADGDGNIQRRRHIAGHRDAHYR